MDRKTQAASSPYKVRLSENAVKNIDEITGYIAFINHQPLNALKVGDAFFAKIRRIEKKPYAFKECESIPTKTKMYRQAKCASWYIIYKIEGHSVTVLGVIHTSRKPSKIKALRKVR
jgi:plasmid stabilization system protein ParE